MERSVDKGTDELESDKKSLTGEGVIVDNYNEDFGSALDELVANSEIVIDRPKGTAHPRFPDFIYKVDYGYLNHTTSMDGGGIDVWVGSDKEKKVDRRLEVSVELTMQL